MGALEILFIIIIITWEGSSSDKLYNSVFSGITGQVGAMLVKLTEKAKTRHSAAAGYFSQLHHYGPTFWFLMNLIGLHRKAKTAIKSTKATRITISYKAYDANLQWKVKV